MDLADWPAPCTIVTISYGYISDDRHNRPDRLSVRIERDSRRHPSEIALSPSRRICRVFPSQQTLYLPELLELPASAAKLQNECACRIMFCFDFMRRVA